MCGRARCSLRADDIPRACRRTVGPTRTINMDRYRSSNNVSPGFNLPVVRRDHGNGNGDEGYAIHCMRWGLIPSFTKKTEKPDFYRMFNARSESLGEMASFRRLLPKSRCLVPVEGFYEWKKDGSKKQPYYIHFKDDRPLVFAALYDSWQNSEGEILYTFTIVTTSSSSALQWLHERMPIILGDKEAVDTWLTDSSAANFKTVLKPYEDSDLVWYPVTPAMGKPSFDGPECIKEITLKMENKSSISKFFSRKEIKGEKEENLEKSGTPEESDIADPPKSVEEHDTEDKSTISKFSSCNEIKEEEDVDLEERGTLGESDSAHLLKSTDEEHGTEDKLGSSSVAKIPDRDIKLCVPSAPCEGGMKSNIKREHEELVTDLKLNTDENKNSKLSPARKKANLKDGSDKQPTRVLSQAKISKRKGVDDKQPTLLSFFSKK